MKDSMSCKVRGHEGNKSTMVEIILSKTVTVANPENIFTLLQRCFQR